ncbi:MAG TPA: hypothetical protein VFN65_03320 [Solirubrobacteraceae bacterium]|nr:hypothetical protein [Solirubrobacteraceae bacterium]
MNSLAQQESVRRLVNEAIERGFWPGESEAKVRIRCECGRGGCHEYVRMRVRDYEELRSDPRRFVVCPGHQTPEVERFVGRGAEYAIVEKIGAAADVAEATDPRSDLSAEPANPD